MSIGRVVPSAISGSYEATIALAAANFDFSLVKIEAPVEYQGLGLSLSNKRSNEAEDGQIHVTARKLGALFADTIPRTPELYHAYGLRASEIAKSEPDNPKGTKREGMFADHLGVDGTSIWAAATSGETAIALHLLACLLARMWSHAEAVSIWVEFIEERKRVISRPNQQDVLNVLALQSSRISLSRSQIAAWDASARAWLQTADEVKKLQQTQLILTLNNIGASVNPKPFLYESVLEAWTTSLVGMENLLKGTNQSVENGASLLGLASWHLYPDMLVLGKATQKVTQNDNLIPAGTLVTIGLHNRGYEQHGIFWSLPLAFLRFYGGPVSRTGCVNQETSRVTIEQLLLVCLGALIGPWISQNSMSENAIMFIGLLSKAILDEDTTASGSSWPLLLGSQAEQYIQTKKEWRTESWQLIAAGMRRYTQFLPRPSQRFFGFLRPINLLKIMENEQRITFLRHICEKRYPQSARRMVIQYLSKLPFGPEQYEYASVTPITAFRNVPKRQLDGSKKLPDAFLMRWIQSSGSSTDPYWVTERQKEIQGLGEKANLVPLDTFLPSLQLRPGMTWTNAPNDIFNVFDEQTGAKEECNPTIGFEMLFGDPKLGAVFATVNDDTLTKPKKRFSLDDITDAFSKGLISRNLLRQYFDTSNSWDVEMTDLYKGLNAVSALALIYNKLHGAKISLQIANRSINDWQWSRSIRDGFYRESMVESIDECSREEAFACTVACESGTIDLDPKSLSAVMAISSGNSLYVSERLLLDPWKDSSPVPVERIVGNVGRPGMVMMIAPDQPRIRKLDEGTWHLINHAEFNGASDDTFQELTLHLSISEWQQAVDINSVGIRDTEVCFVNGIVGLHDHGEWVADLDILGMAQREDWRLLPAVTCYCNVSATKITSFPWSLSSIDKWEELIECPANASIIRARDNWQARLALAVLSVQLGHRTYIIPPNLCWKCCIRQHTVLPANPFQCFREDGNTSDPNTDEESQSEICSSDGDSSHSIEENWQSDDMESDCVNEDGQDEEEQDEETLACFGQAEHVSHTKVHGVSKSRLCDVYIW